MSGNHLDAFSGRNVVYCHQCEHEWYEDDAHGLDCPRCQSGATEIVTEENDPRNIPDHHGPQHHDDPEEDDINEYMSRAPGGASFFSRTYQSPGFDRSGDGRRPVEPNNPNDIISRFTDMLMNDLGGNAARPQVGRSGPEHLFPSFPPGPHDPHADRDAFAPRANMTFSTRTFTRNRDGSTSVIVATGPMRGGPGERGPPMDFDQTFGQLLQGIRPPTHGQQGPPPGGLPDALHQLLSSMLRPSGAGVYGDAVFSQQALDRVISDLMEANPQSNAAPPATQNAIDRLERKKADAKMLDADGKGEAKGECTICISDVSVGDEVVCLPCKHWFHEDCVIMWLKEHNTCPVCRMAIEENSRGPQNNGGSRGGSHAGSPMDPNGPSGSGSGNANGNANQPDIFSSGFNWGGSSNFQNQPYNRRNNNPFSSPAGENRQEDPPVRGYPFSSIFNPPPPNNPTPPSHSPSPHAGGFYTQQNRDRNAERLERIERLRNPDGDPSGENLAQRRSHSPRGWGGNSEEGSSSRPWRTSLSMRGDRRSSSGRESSRREGSDQQSQGSSRGFLGRIGDSLPWGSNRHERDRRS